MIRVLTTTLLVAGIAAPVAAQTPEVFPAIVWWSPAADISAEVVKRLDSGKQFPH